MVTKRLRLNNNSVSESTKWVSPIHAVKKSDGSWRICGYFHRLKQAFQQVYVEESAQEKTAFITTLGLYKFIRIPYGIQCFQRNVDQLLSDLPFAHFVYMGDVIVSSGNKEDHVRDLRRLFQRMKDAGLLLKKNKCVLGLSSIKFQGHIVDSQGISIPPDRVDDIKRFPRPKTAK